MQPTRCTITQLQEFDVLICVLFSWQRNDRPDLAQHRLDEATAMFESLRYENSSIPFLSMQPFWNDLKGMITVPGPDESDALIDTDTEPHEHLEFSSLGNTSSSPIYARLAPDIEDVDSEGFTSQDAGHVAHI